MSRHVIVGTTVFAVVVLSMVFATAGCQSSGHTETTTSTEARPVTTDSQPYATTTPPPADLTAYNVAYTTSTDTPWMKASTDTTPSGTLTKGQTVYVRGAAPSSGTVQVKTSDNRLVWVRATDLAAR